MRLRLIGWLGAASLMAPYGWCAPGFDVASVKPFRQASYARGIRSGGGPGSSTPGAIRWVMMPLAQIVERAFGVPLDRISGPGWTKDFSGTNWYEVVATYNPKTSTEDFRLMLQDLLSERFDLKVHIEKRRVGGYVLEVISGNTGLKPSLPAAEDRAQSASPLRADGLLARPTQDGVYFISSVGVSRSVYRGQTLDRFARDLGLLMNRDADTPEAAVPVVSNGTGLTGKYDFTLAFACRSCAGLPQGVMMSGAVAPAAGSASDPAIEGSVPDLREALRTQLGLKLRKAEDAEVEYLVIDSALKVPKPN